MVFTSGADKVVTHVTVTHVTFCQCMFNNINVTKNSIMCVGFKFLEFQRPAYV